MKRVIKSLSAIALCLCMLLPLAACGSKDELPAENIVEDSYDNYYEIFPYSFCDSDGNGIGDLDGITEKLGYVRDLGYTGIWLMPVNKTVSYTATTSPTTRRSTPYSAPWRTSRNCSQRRMKRASA